MRITWYGHSNFKLEDGGISILIDPFFSGNPSTKANWREAGTADVVLVTHDHGDHVGEAVDICRATNAMLGAIVGTADKLCEAGVPRERILNGIGFNLGGTLEVGGAVITMVPAFHTSESGVPAGYIVKMPGGFTVYHAGDTCIYGDMEIFGELYSPDLALLPVGGVFTMDARQAALACKLLKTKAVVPMHYGTFPALEKNADNFAAELSKTVPACKCYVMRPDSTLEL